MTETITSCDNCKTAQTKGEHWFTVLIYKGRYARKNKFTVSLSSQGWSGGARTPATIEYDLCSPECVVSKLGPWMKEEINRKNKTASLPDTKVS